MTTVLMIADEADATEPLARFASILETVMSSIERLETVGPSA